MKTKAICVYGVIEQEVGMLVEGKVIKTIHKMDILGQSASIYTDLLGTSKTVAKSQCTLACLN